MLEVLADIDHVLLGVVVGAEHPDQGLLCLVQSALLNTESKVDIKSEKGDDHLRLTPIHKVKVKLQTQ